MNVALVGNPNSGKTTLFNELTGSSQYVGNWPGVTVEKKEGKLKKHKDVRITDLPGVYSLSPYTLEEVITREYLIETRPDVIINIVDATNLERNLYLTTQVLELGIPTVIALNMMDIMEKQGNTVEVEKLGEKLTCPVVPISAQKGTGIDRLLATVMGQVCPPGWELPLSAELKQGIVAIEQKLEDVEYDPKYDKRWLAVKILERDEKVAVDGSAFDQLVEDFEQRTNDDGQSMVTDARYQYLGENITGLYTKAKAGSLSPSDKIDRVVTNRWLAIPIFLGIMFVVYFLSIQWLGNLTIGWVEGLFEAAGTRAVAAMEGAGAAQWLIGLVADGIIGGVGAVLVFVPQLMILFAIIALLEDCGYMARVAFIMDRIFRRFGLSGKSFIPMIIGTGCSVPGIMASRTIENDKDRKMTILLTPFIPCGAKLPVFALFVGAFFPQNPFVAPSMYLIGMIMVIVSGVILKRTKPFQGDPAPFVMELPAYKLPSAKGLLIHVWDRTKAFVLKAGTIIFLASCVIWFLCSFGWGMQMVEIDQSMLASIGRGIAPLFAPLGWGNWQSAVASVTGLLAKETVVATFGIVLGAGEEILQDDPTLVQSIGSFFNMASAYSFMVFTLLSAPCFAAIGAMRREFGSWKWTLYALLYQTGIAYLVAFVFYQVFRLFL